MNPIIEAFEKKFELHRRGNDLRQQFTPDEVEEYLKAFYESGIKYDMSNAYVLRDIFCKFPDSVWLHTILSMLEKFPLSEHGFPYSSSSSQRRITKADGTEETVNFYHPGMQLVNEAFYNFPDLFKNHLELLFIHNIALYREEDVVFWQKYGNDYIVFFRHYLNENQTSLNTKRAIVKMLQTGGTEMKALAAETIRKNFTDAEELKWLNRQWLQEAGLEWTNNSFRELHSQKPLHLIFSENYFKEEKKENYTKAVNPLPHIYQWGGWKTIKKLSGKDSTIQHLITLDPIPEHLGITSVKKLELVINLEMVLDEGVDGYYKYDADGKIRIEADSPWVYEDEEEDDDDNDEEDDDDENDGEKNIPSRPAFAASDIQLSDQGEEFCLQGWDHNENINRLGGMPYFVQDYHYPECCDCKQTMTFILQLDSDLLLEDGEECMWGSGGLAYIYWCDSCRVSSICWFCT